MEKSRYLYVGWSLPDKESGLVVGFLSQLSVLVSGTRFTP